MKGLKMKHFKFIAMAACLLFAVSSVSACSNTVRGAGQDVEEVGHEMEECC